MSRRAIAAIEAQCRSDFHFALVTIVDKVVADNFRAVLADLGATSIPDTMCNLPSALATGILAEFKKDILADTDSLATLEAIPFELPETDKLTEQLRGHTNPPAHKKKPATRIHPSVHDRPLKKQFRVQPDAEQESRPTASKTTTASLGRTRILKSRLRHPRF
jgi:hypothetical protein